MSVAGRRGSVRPDAAGRWSFIVDVATPGGPRRQVRRRGFPTKKAARAALTATLGKLGEGSYVEPSKLTVRDYVETRWLPVVQGELRASTVHSYRRNLRLHVLPRLGALRLQALDPAALQALYAELVRHGRADHERGAGLAPRTVHYIHTIIRSALTTTVGWDLIPRNPADRVKPPRQQAQANRHQHLRTWTREELRAFLDATRGERLFPLWLLLATSGLRRGEALGLGWSAVALNRGSVSIRRSLVDVTTAAGGSHPVFSDPKTARGSRQVVLDLATLAALRDRREVQAKEYALLGAAPAHDLVFTHEDGRPYHPDRLARVFTTRVRRAGLPGIRLHDLRHAGVGSRRAPQGRLRATRSLHGHHHVDDLQPCPAGAACRRRRTGRRLHPR